MSTIRTYDELRRLETFEERFKYLSLSGRVGESTFAFDRWLNQVFYTSKLWREIRSAVILRDEGLDLGVEGYPVHARGVVHHMNPMSIEDVKAKDPAILNPDFLVFTSHTTHNAIHYGDQRQVPRQLVVRKQNDTKLW